MVVVCTVLLQLRGGNKVGRVLENSLPLYKVEDDCMLSKQGDLTVVFSVDLPEIFTLNSDEYENLHHIWVRAVKLLPAGTVLHKQDWYTQEKYQAKAEKLDQSFLDRASEAFFHERPILEHRCYVMVTRKAVGRKPSTSAFSNLLRSSFIAPEQLSAQAYNDFLDKIGQFQQLLGEGGYIKVRRMTDEEIVGNDQKAGLLERYCFLLSETEKPLMRDIVFKPEMMIGENHCQLYALADVEDLPGICGPRLTYDKYSTDRTKYPIGFAAPVGQLLDCNHIYNQVVFVEDTPKKLKQLEAKRRRLRSLSAYSRENTLSEDAVNNFLNEAISQNRQPVRAHYNLFAWTEDPAKLKDLRNKVSSAIAQMDANPRQELHGAPQIFWSCIPGNAADLPENEQFDTFAEQSVCFFSVESGYRDSVSEFGFRLVDRLSGRPLWVDISDLPMKLTQISNRNKLVIGGSGSGKSVTMAHLHRSYYEQGAHIVIVDVGHSYKGLCDLVGGVYLTYEEKNPIKFNPFYISDGDVLDTEKKESLKSLLVALWKKDDENFKRSEYVALSNALHLYFEHLAKHSEIFPCFNSFYEYLRDFYVDVLKKDGVKDRDFDIDNFLYVLRPYYGSGEFGYLLNSTENLDLLHERFIVFELDNVKDHPILFPVITLIVMENFISKMRKLKGIRKVITIEEAWKAIAKQGMAEFIKYLYKTVRKFFGEAIVVTQEIDDVISSPVVKEAIINNADCKILLDMRKFANKFDAIQAALGLTDKAKMMILSLNKANDPRRKYREFFIDLAGQSMKVYCYEPSPAEYYAYTTEEREKVMVQHFTALNGGDMKKGIRALLAHLNQK